MRKLLEICGEQFALGMILPECDQTVSFNEHKLAVHCRVCGYRDLGCCLAASISSVKLHVLEALRRVPEKQCRVLSGIQECLSGQLSQSD
jgi:hypothetical protein